MARSPDLRQRLREARKVKATVTWTRSWPWFIPTAFFGFVAWAQYYLESRTLPLPDGYSSEMAYAIVFLSGFFFALWFERLKKVGDVRWTQTMKVLRDRGLDADTSTKELLDDPKWK